MRRTFAMILLLGATGWLGGCESWFEKDPYEAKLNQLPEPSSGLERLIELRKRQRRQRKSRPLDISDPNYMDKARKRSDRNRQQTLESFQKALAARKSNTAHDSGPKGEKAANWFEKLFSPRPTTERTASPGP